MSLVNLPPISSNFQQQPTDIIKTIGRMDVGNLENMSRVNHLFYEVLKTDVFNLRYEQLICYSVKEIGGLSRFIKKFPGNEPSRLMQLTALKISWPLLWEISTWDKSYAEMIKSPSFIKNYIESCYTFRHSALSPEMRSSTLIELIKFLPDADRPTQIRLPIQADEKGGMQNSHNTSNPLISTVLSLLSNPTAIDLSFQCTLTDRDIKLLSGGSLVELSLDAFTFFSDIQFNSIIKNSPNLRSLRCLLRTPGAFAALKASERLTELSFAYKGEWSEKQIGTLSSLLPRLTKLEIFKSQLTSDQFYTLFSQPTYQHQPLKLLHVSLSNSSLNDKGLEPLLKNSPSIQEIDLNNTQITDASLPLITKYLKQLRSISLAKCKEITPIGILNFVTEQPFLKEIYTGHHDFNYRC